MIGSIDTSLLKQAKLRQKILKNYAQGCLAELQFKPVPTEAL